MTQDQKSELHRYRDVKSQSLRVHGSEEGAVQTAIFATIQGLLRTLSHALGNPLAGLSLTLELLGGTALSASQQRYVERCMRVAERLNLHKENWGRMGSPEGQGPFSPIDLCLVIEHVLGSMHLGHEFAINVDVPEDAGMVCAHEGLLALALSHLVRNAVEALGQGGAMGIRARKNQDQVRISVWDDGPGLSREVQDALWIRPIPGKLHSGGVGLFWVAAIVESVHHGNLSYTLKESKGTAFHIELASGHPAAGHL